MLSPSMSGHPITAEVRSLLTWPDRQAESRSDRDEGRGISILGRIAGRQASYVLDGRIGLEYLPEAEDLNQYRRRAELW